MTESALKVHFSSGRNHWETLQSFFDTLNEEFHFELDVCATSENAKCKILRQLQAGLQDKD